jgi:uncharacterized membrane protein
LGLPRLVHKGYGLNMDGLSTKIRLLLTVLVLGISACVQAKSEFLDLFMSTYKISDSSPLGQKACLICHQNEDDYSKMNVYGRDLKKGLADAGTNSLTEAILAKVGALDSNGSGKTNEQKITAGTAPGDPGPAKAPTEDVAPAKPKSLIPKNFFHPAIVHFPIALFIAGLLLDFLGLKTNHKELLLAGWYNLVMAAVTSFGGIATGFGAMFIQKVPFKGPIFLHMILALVSATLMLIMVGLRIHRHEKLHLPTRILYYVLATTCFVLISYAGHLGGAFVYGE